MNSNEPEESIQKLKTAEAMFQEMGMDFWLDKTQQLLAAI